MGFDLTEIAQILRQQIGQYQASLETARTGRVVGLADGIAHIYGLDEAMVGEVLRFENDVLGEVFNLEQDCIGAVIYGDYTKVKEGSEVVGTGQLLSVPVGEQLLGRAVDPLCQPVDGGPPIARTKTRLVETPAPGIAQRQPVRQPLQTGIKAIDSMIPIGRGQRELIIGDRKTGKTAIAIDTIINQKDQDVICVYVAIGQRAAAIAEVVDVLNRYQAMPYTVIVAASASDSAPMQYIAPYVGCTIAEYFMYKQHKDTLCVYDDLTKHAIAYRQLSLLLRRPPGREAYPGDIFYLHSRLLERSAKLADKPGGGSLTALPIVETLEGQISAYIPTNVISITDGQIYLQRDLFHAGIRPAIDVGISVSRVGGDAQAQAMKKVAGKLRLDLAAYQELQAFARLGTELDPATQAQLDRGSRMIELLKQPQLQPCPLADQVVTIYLGSAGLLDDIPIGSVRPFVAGYLEFLRDSHPEILEHINRQRTFPDELATEIDLVVAQYKQQWSG